MLNGTKKISWSVFSILSVMGMCQLAAAAGPAANGDVLSGKAFYTSTGAKGTGTMPAGSNVTGTDGSLVVTIPAGYYDGTKTATAADSDLLAENILSGTTIFGVEGTATLESGHVACNASGQTDCVSSAGFLPGTPRTSVTGGNGATQITIPQGYYDGTSTATAADTNLTASKIKKDIAIFGVTGTAVLAGTGYSVGQGAAAGDILKDKQAWDKDGTLLTGSLVNRGAFDATLAFPGAGYYSGMTKSLIPPLICSGTDVGGYAGTALCTGGTMMSWNIFHDRDATVYSQTAEASVFAGSYLNTPLPADHRVVPVISKDDDGYVSPGVFSSQIRPVTRSADGTEWEAGVPRRVCGKDVTTINDKIADCDTQHAVKPSWNIFPGTVEWSGLVNSNSGQGSWTLVTIVSLALANGAVCDTDCREVWRDDRTGLLWSSVLGSDNWCRAAGNAEAGDAAYCANAVYQPDFPIAQSWCAELGPTQMKETAAAGESWASQSYHRGKGGMGMSTTPSVRWRLPTQWDYWLADANGSRYVLTNNVNAVEWIATIRGADRTYARAFNSYQGGMTNYLRSTNYGVRCVGR
ncbi:MAG TPA: hypothetical protein VJB59_14115 [Bdellovibrionota bacterium]|nr:hypothetical protein [Bdellovibrionota bacterium]